MANFPFGQIDIIKHVDDNLTDEVADLKPGSAITVPIDRIRYARTLASTENTKAGRREFSVYARPESGLAVIARNKIQ